MTLQAYIDESSDEKRAKFFTMAGYIAPEEVWSAFSKDWDEHLKEHGLNAFKLTEMPNSAPEHIASFYRIIEKHQIPLSFDIVIDIGMWQMVVAEIDFPPQAGKLKRMLDNPYFLATKKMMQTLYGTAADIGFDEPIDIIYDEQIGSQKILLDAWETFKTTLPEKSRRCVGSVPSFENDKKFTPLQAADLIAGYVQRAAMEGKDPVSCDMFPWKPAVNSRMRRLVRRFSENELREELHGICSKENFELAIKSLRKEA